MPFFAERGLFRHDGWQPLAPDCVYALQLKQAALAGPANVQPDETFAFESNRVCS